MMEAPNEPFSLSAFWPKLLLPSFSLPRGVVKFLASPDIPSASLHSFGD